MKKNIFYALTIALATQASTALAQVNFDTTNRFTVEYKAGEKDAAMAAIAEFGATVRAELDFMDMVSIEVNSLAPLKSLRNSPVINDVAYDPIRSFGPTRDVEILGHTNDPLVDHPGMYGLAQVQADLLHEADANGGVKVCVIDTGYDRDHVELPSLNASGSSEGAGPWYGPDLHFHGTHVAGTILAIGNNGLGISGVISNAENAVPGHHVRVFDSAGGFVHASGLVGAIKSCQDAGANVVNMSLGGALSSKAEKKAFERFRKDGMLLIAAAGNDGIATHSYPASYDSVMSVAANDSNANHAGFSQRTSQVEISGPGVDVLSTYPGNFLAFASGTSMATPHVAAAAAQVWSHYPQCSNYDIRSALKASAMDIDAAGRDYATGYGLVQIKAAYDYLDANGCSGQVCRGNECKPD